MTQHPEHHEAVSSLKRKLAIATAVGVAWTIAVTMAAPASLTIAVGAAA